MKTIRCKNPACQREFVPDSAHRCLPYCCPMCQRIMTPRTNVQRTVKGEVGIVLSKAPISRKHGTDRKTQTE